MSRKNSIKCKFCERNFNISEIPRAFLSKWETPEFCNLCLCNALMYRSTDLIAYENSDGSEYPRTVVDEDFEKPSKPQMITDLRKFTEELNHIPKSIILRRFPPKDFYTEYNPEKIIPLLIDYQMAWYEDYKKEFGSWFKALVVAEIIDKDDFIESTYGYRCLAKDGHECLSLDERKIDNFMSKKGIKHEKEPYYPLDDELNPEKGYRADWRVGNYLIEYFGIMSDNDYANKVKKKQKLAKKHNINLIALHPEDLGKLEKKLQPVM